MTRITVKHFTVQREEEQTVDEVQWEPGRIDIVERQNGPAVAAIVAAGVGAAAMGFLTTLSEASESFADWLKFQDRVGPLSGKTSLMVVAWLVAWAVLAPLLWKRSLTLNGIYIITAILLAVGFVGTFPKFFDLFAA